jgi:hypothetical protein
MAAITKNRNFFKGPKLLYFKPESLLCLYSSIWALSGLKSSSFGHLKKFLFLVMADILDTGRC